MADFNPPFANENDQRRFPTVLEKANGFGCGDADLNLFNGMFWCIQKEIVEVIKAGGLAPSNASHTQLRDAILALLPENTDTNTFLNAINGKANGAVNVTTANNQLTFSLSNGRNWTVNLPDVGISMLNTPADILNVAQPATANYDSGNVNLNLNLISGVTVPAGAQGVILQAATSISGDQLRVGQNIDGGFVWIQAGGALSSANSFSPATAANVVSYVDTNLGGNDNDSTSYPMVKINGTTLPYRARARWDGFNGLDTAYLRMRLVGFVL